jgi:ribose transport system substrate-binding protein
MRRVSITALAAIMTMAVTPALAQEKQALAFVVNAARPTSGSSPKPE